MDKIDLVKQCEKHLIKSQNYKINLKTPVLFLTALQIDINFSPRIGKKFEPKE